MIKKLFILFLGAFLVTSCGSSRKVVKKTRKRIPRFTKKSQNKNTQPTILDKVVWTAVSYKGVPYKYAGATRSGMDCSGLIYTSFKKRNIVLPRSSKLLYREGFPISLRQVKRGDLLFFKTSKKRRQSVNHVGLVTSAKNGDIRFIHSTVSKGVIVSSLHSKYWRNSFVNAKRILK